MSDEAWDAEGLIEDLVATGVDDWIDLGLVVQIARRGGARGAEAETMAAIGLVTVALVDGLITLGEVRADGFVPWDVDVPTAIVRLVSEWWARGLERVLPGDVAWLSNTEKGDALGRSVLDREHVD